MTNGIKLTPKQIRGALKAKLRSLYHSLTKDEYVKIKAKLRRESKGLSPKVANT